MTRTQLLRQTLAAKPDSPETRALKRVLEEAAAQVRDWHHFADTEADPTKAILYRSRAEYHQHYINLIDTQLLGAAS